MLIVTLIGLFGIISVAITAYIDLKQKTDDIPMTTIEKTTK